MKKYIFAVSGGPDSMAMLNMFYKKAQAVCVVNYNKRKTSDYDVSLVVDFCNLHNIKYYVHNVDKKIYKNVKNVNFQAFARQIRYDFFEKVAKIEKNHNLMVAHNLNDHLESAYMQKSKNSRALFYGIKQKSAYKTLNIYRPLLNLQKSCLKRYCIENNVKFAIDESNEMNIYERNRVRKIINSWNQEQLIKFIKEIRIYNKKNKKLSKKVEKKFNQWKLESFSINFFNKFKNDDDIKYHLIYNFLSHFNERNNSYNKIIEIIKFIEKQNSKGNYRLENNKKIFKKDKKLIII